jgi:hypothetical protein
LKTTNQYFYELFLYDPNPKKYHPIPVRIKNLASGNGYPNSQDPYFLCDNGNVLVRRFFLYDIVSSITYDALNNQLDIPFININSSIWSFDIYLAVVIVMANTNDNLYCNFQIRGVNKSDIWEIISTYVGDDTGIEFDIVNDIITSNGLVRYSTPDYGIDVSSITFKYRMITN